MAVIKTDQGDEIPIHPFSSMTTLPSDSDSHLDDLDDEKANHANVIYLISTDKMAFQVEIFHLLSHR